MAIKKNKQETSVTSSSEPAKSKPSNNKSKFRFLGKSLLLKQSLLATWKSKLQLVILLLLSAFATALLTGTYISYQRIVAGAQFLDVDDAKFDAVLPYSSAGISVTQIANQAFSLHTGRLYYQDGSGSPIAIYYDDTIIGQQTLPIQNTDLNVTYTRDGSNKINGFSKFEWAKPNQPLTFDLSNPYIKASLYGQLMEKYNNASGFLKQRYLSAAEDLYRDLFLNPFDSGNSISNSILLSLEDYFKKWITSSLTQSNPILIDNDSNFTSWLLVNKVNFRGESSTSTPDPNDSRIPFSTNVKSPEGMNVLNNLLVKANDPNPRVTDGTTNYGMNGQWMNIYRNFDMSPTPADSVLSDFLHQYSSPYYYNMVTDNNGGERFYSYTFAKAAAALQNREIHVANQFTAVASVDINQVQYDVKVIDLGQESQHNHPNLKVFEGIYPTSRNEIVITPQYARKYKIHPGDSITINKWDFIVSGIGGDAYNLYPILNSTDPVPNTRTQFIAYVYSDAFNDATWYAPQDVTDTSLIYFLPWKNLPAPGFDVNQFNDFFQKTIFSKNGLNDLLQYDYTNYLIKKYADHKDYTSKYTIVNNLVVTSDSSQFAIYAQQQNIFDSILSGFKYAAFGAVIFIVLIVCFITYLIVKKAIQKGQVSMGILKSSGYTTKKIAFSYLAYPILALVIAIPIGWLAGLVAQVYFTEIFNTLFVLPYNAFSFDIIPLFISIGVIVGFILITTLLTAFRILQKPPLMLIKQDSDIAIGRKTHIGWLESRIQHNFKLKFLLSLSKTSWKKIAVTAGVIGLASLAITSTVAIPATITNMKNNYFKSQKYENYYQYQTPLPNMPLSKYGLYAWSNLANPNNEPYYPVSGVMPWADNLIINDPSTGKKLGWYSPLEYKLTSPSSNNFANIVHFYDGVDVTTQTNIKTQIGQYLLTSDPNNGPLQTDLITWNYSWLGGRGFSNRLLKDLANKDLSPNQQYSNSLINLATTLLPGILGVSNPGVPPGPDAIAEILKQVLPGYIRQILDTKGKDAYDFFSVGHNTVAYNPDYQSSINGAGEELVTQFQVGSTNSDLLNKGFLDIAGINPSTNMLVIDKNLVDSLKYNSSQTQIPMVVNRAFAAKYNLSSGDQFTAAPNIRTLYYLDKNGVKKPLPKDSWYYGKNPETDFDASGPVDVWNKSANKFNYRGQLPVGSTSFSDTFGYNYNGVYDKDGKRVVSKEPNSWNDMNQVWMKLPNDINDQVKKGTIRNYNGSDSLAFDTANIDAATGSDWIKPFSFSVTDANNNQPVDPTSLLTNKTPEWYEGMLDKGFLLTDNTLHLESLKKDIANNMPTWWQNVIGNSNPIHTYKVIGVQDSYDTPRGYVDQKWANSIVGYSLQGQSGDGKDPVYSPGIYQWFSGKLSSYEDIFDIIGRLSSKYTASDYTLYGTSNLGGNKPENLIANADLLSRKKQMLTKMSDIAFSASAIFIITTILCSILIVIMITDLFTDQFRRFMAHMKAEGYTNWEINSFTLGIFTPWVVVGYLVGVALGFLTVFTFIKLLQVLIGLVLPFTFIWWLIPFSFVIIGGIYASTFIINNNELNKMNLIVLLKSDE